jgi:hypothetical protein
LEKKIKEEKNKEIADKLLKMALTDAQIVEAAGLWKSNVEKMRKLTPTSGRGRWGRNNG